MLCHSELSFKHADCRAAEHKRLNDYITPTEENAGKSCIHTVQSRSAFILLYMSYIASTVAEKLMRNFLIFSKQSSSLTSRPLERALRKSDLYGAAKRAAYKNKHRFYSQAYASNELMTHLLYKENFCSYFECTLNSCCTNQP